MNISLDFDTSVTPTLRPPDYYQVWDRDDWGLRSPDFPITRQKLVYLFPKPRGGTYEVRAWFSALFKFLALQAPAPSSKGIKWNARTLHDASEKDVEDLMRDAVGTHDKDAVTALVLTLRKRAQEAQAREIRLLALQPDYSPPESPIIFPIPIQAIPPPAPLPHLNSKGKAAITMIILFLLWVCYSAVFT